MEPRNKFDSSGLFDSSGRLISTVPTPAHAEEPGAAPIQPQSVEIANPSSPQSGGAVPPKNPGDTAAHREPPPQISNAEFVKAIFGTLPDRVSAVVCSKPGDPTSGGWHAMKAGQVDQQCLAGWNNYANCSIFREESPGTIHARKDSFSALHFILLDDMGTKAQWAQLGDFKPSFVIETSPGNYQAGIILAQPLVDIEMATRLLNAVIAKGMSDPGATGVARWARLPVGINGKPKYKTPSGDSFLCRLVRWNPERRYKVAEIVAGLKLELIPVEVVNLSGNGVGSVLPPREINPASVARLPQLLEAIDPDCERDDWVHVLMAVFHTTGGSEEGFALVDAWSSKGRKYRGTRDIEIQWKSFRLDIANPRTIGTLIKLAREAGADVQSIMHSEVEHFDACETKTIDAGSSESTGSSSRYTPLDRYSLKDSLVELEKQRVEQRLILGDIVLLGQATVFYALANTGKTLILLYLIIDAIRRGLIDPSKLYYINMDDNSSGLVDKVRLAVEYGFHMLADGHRGFAAKDFRAAMEKMIATNTAGGAIVVVDTLKKFVNTMNKEQSADFARVVRQFALKGGTVVALSHANKNPGADGKVKYTGTTDIVDDFDCAYTLQSIDVDTELNQRVVEFENIKRRGDVAETAAYRYSTERGLSYSELLTSVQEVDRNQLGPIKSAAKAASDATVIAAIEACIVQGINTKMRMVDAGSKSAGVSTRAALKVIEKYTGEDTARHRWRYVVRARGAQVFELLERPEATTADMVGGVAAYVSPDDSNGPAEGGSGNVASAMGQAKTLEGNTLEDALKQSDSDGGNLLSGAAPLDIF